MSQEVLRIAYDLIRNGISRQPTGRPRRLKVKPTGDTVNIQHFSREKQILYNSALHRSEIHFIQFHAAAGNELLFELSFALDDEFTGRQFFRELS